MVETTTIKARFMMLADALKLVRRPELAGYVGFVNGGEFLTRAELKAKFPASADMLGYFAKVSDIWGSVKTILFCETNGTVYYWRPIHQNYSAIVAQTSGTINLVPLVTPPILIMKTGLLGSVTIVPQTTDAFPGCSFEIQAPASLGLFSLNIGGLVGNLTSGLLGGTKKRVVYTGSGYEVA